MARVRTPRKNRIKNALSWEITNWIMVVFYSIFCAFYLYILFWLVMTCCKTHLEIALDPFALPTRWRWDHFSQMVEQFEYKRTGFWGMVWNSTWVSVGGALIVMLTAASTSYIATRYTFPCSKYLAPFIMFTLIFPLYGSSGANYRLMFELGLHDGPMYLLWFVGFGGWIWFYFQSFWINLSWTYAEAAKIDGANDWIIFYQIMFPQAMGMFLALFIGQWSTYWQDYGSALLYLRETPTLSLGIYYFEQEMQYRARRDILFCACLVSSIPSYVMYACFQGFMYKNVSIGGIKA
jgi:ABC-type glycerol-3-phosphate transport system permease component